MPVFLRKYATGTGMDVHIPIIKRAVVDGAVGADWTPAAGDVKISIDGAAVANIGTLPVVLAAGNTAWWKFVFTNAELTGKVILVSISDSATKAIEDDWFIIETYGNASAMYQWDMSVANLPANIVQAAGTAWNSGAITSSTFAAGAINAAAIATGAIDADALAADTLTAAKFAADVWTEARTAINGGDWALSTNSSGMIRIADGIATGELDTASGVVLANLAQILATAVTEGAAGRLAGGFVKWFNVASPTGTVNSIPDALPDTLAGLPSSRQVNRTVRPFRTTYYVRADGSDTNDGLTPATAFLTFDKARTTATSDGDHIELGSGEFSQAAALGALSSGVSIRGQGFSATRLKSTAASAGGLIPGNNTCIEDLTIDCPSDDCIVLGISKTNVRVRRCAIFTGSTGVALAVGAGSTMYVEDSFVSSTANALALVLSNGAGGILELTRCTIHNTFTTTLAAVTCSNGKIRLMDCSVNTSSTTDLEQSGSGVLEVTNVAYDTTKTAGTITLKPYRDQPIFFGLDHLVSTSVTGTDVADNSIFARIVSKSATADWDTFVNTTESLEALRDILGTPAGATFAVDLAAIQADTDNIQTRLPAALVGGRMDSSVGAMAADVITAAATATDYITELQTAVTGGAYPISTDAGGKVRIVDGTGAGELDTSLGVVLARDHLGASLATAAVLGTPAGASIAADIAVIESQTDDIGIAGAGLTSVPWNAAWDAEVESEVNDALVALKLDKLILASGTADSGSTTTMVDAARTEADPDYWKGRILQFTSGNIAGQCAIIEDFNAATDTFTFKPALTQPVTTQDYVILAAVSPWDETLAEHLTAGTTGSALNAAGSAGDPWATSLPGAYGAGSAGFILGTNLNATVSSRASQASVDTIDGIVDAILLDTGTDGVVVNAAGLAADAVNEIRDAVTGYAGSLSVNASGMVRVADGTGVGEIDTLSGTVLLRSGTEASIASILADTNELQTDWVNGGRLDLLIDTIKAKTDQLTFTLANKIDSSIQAAGDVTAAVANKIADHILRRSPANVEASANGDILALSSLYGIVQQLQKSNTTTTAGKLTVFKTGGTQLGQLTLTSDATADPITGAS